MYMSSVPSTACRVSKARITAVHLGSVGPIWVQLDSFGFIRAISDNLHALQDIKLIMLIKVIAWLP